MANDNDQDVRSNIIINVDEAQAKKAQSIIIQTQSVVVNYNNAVEKGAASTRKLSNEEREIAKAAREFERDQKKLNTTLKEGERQTTRLAAMQRDLANATRDASTEAGGGGGADGRSRTAQIATSIRNLPSVAIPGTGVSTEVLSKVVLSIDRLGISLTSLGVAAVPVIVALAGVKIAFDKFVDDAVSFANEATGHFLTGIQRAYDMIASGGTTDDARHRLEELAVAMQATADEAALYEAILAQNVQEIDRLSRLNQGMAELYDIVRDTPLDQLREAASGARDEFHDLASETSGLQNAIIGGAFAANDARAAEEELADARRQAAEESEKQQKELADAVKKYNDDVEAITQQGYEQRARLELQFQDNIIKINERAATELTRAVSKIQDSIASLTQDVGRDLADMEREAQIKRLEDQRDYLRSEAQDLTEHLRNLRDIREQGELDDAELIASRNFRELYFARRRRTVELQNAERSFQEDRADKLLKFQQDAADQQAAFIEDRQQRIAKYNQDIADAQAAFKREQAEIARNRAQSLVMLKQSYYEEQRTLAQKITQELALRKQGIVAELRLIQQGGAARLAMEAKIQAALIAQAQAMLASVTGGSTSNTTTSVTLNQTNNVTGGSNAQAVASYIDQQIITTLKNILGVVN